MIPICRSSIFAVALLVGAGSALPQSRGGRADEHWVATWATALQLVAGPARMGGPPPNNASQQGGGRAPQAGRGNSPNASSLPATFSNQTLRQIVRTSLGGKRVRIELSNMANAQPLEVGAAHIAIHKGGGAIAEGTGRALTFGGSASFTLQPGALAVSDPVDLEFPAQTDLAVSLYLPKDTGTPTNHTVGLHTAYIASGNVAGAAGFASTSTTSAYAWLSSVDVAAPTSAFTIVALGDSITDGYATTKDADRAWPTLLAKRLNANASTRQVAVVNQGISGNQVLRDGAGQSALARFDRDVLGRPGVRWVILLEGINDINIRGRSESPTALTAEELIWGYRQIVERCHAHGIRVVGATIMPEEGVPTASERGEAIRQKVNEWIRAKGNFDAVVDFDAVVRDPQHPIRLKAEFDPGDHIHPNDVGNQAMADALDLKIFR